MKVYIIETLYTQVNESWNKEYGLEGVYTTHKEAKMASLKILRDHFLNANSIEIPRTISFKKLKGLAEEEEVNLEYFDFDLDDDAVIRWTLHLNIISKPLQGYLPKDKRLVDFRKDTSQFIEDVFEVAHGENAISKGFAYTSVLKKLKAYKRDAKRWSNRFKPVYKKQKSKTGRLIHYCIMLEEKKKRISMKVYDAAKQQAASRK